MFTYFNNECVRKLVIGFGSLFNNIKIKNLEKGGTLVDYTIPLTYAPKEKYLKRLTQLSSISENKTRVQIAVPQMAFEMLDMVYDPTRRLGKTKQKIQGTSSSYSEAPYNFTFGLYAYTRNIEDNLQIIEQILPYFSPEFVLTLNLTSIHQKVDVPITLVKTILTEEYEGDFSFRRAVTSTFQFVVKSYVYAPITTTTLTQNFSITLSEETSGITFGIN